MFSCPSPLAPRTMVGRLMGSWKKPEKNPSAEALSSSTNTVYETSIWIKSSRKLKSNITNLDFMVNQQLYWWDNTKESQSLRMHGREPQSSSECLTKWFIGFNNSAWVSEVQLRTPSAFISLWTPSLQPVHRDHLLWMNIPLNSAKQMLHNMVVRCCIIWTKLLPSPH